MEFYQNEEFVRNFINLIKECNEIVLKIYNTDFTVINKSDNSPLTQADKECNTHICKYLKNFTNTTIISEEIKNESYDTRKDSQWCWLVDPIDGTKEFVKKNGQFTVNIGLCRYGVPVFGIVSIPVTGEIYYGVEGIGSFKIEGGVTKRLNVNSEKPDDKIKIIASASHMNPETEEYIKQFSNPELVTVGSSIKLLWIAENKAHIYPRIAPTSEWDTCAAHAVVKYAGGHVKHYQTKQELSYNKENLLNPFFIVT